MPAFICPVVAHPPCRMWGRLRQFAHGDEAGPQQPDDDTDTCYFTASGERARLESEARRRSGIEWSAGACEQ